MPTIYEATLDHSGLSWTSGGPPNLPPDGVKVLVTVPDPEHQTRQWDGSAMAAALEALVQSGVVAKFGDPVEWQREIRQDKPQSGRDA